MEQRIDSIIPAGTDPAYVPGVTPARPDHAEEDAPERAAEQEPGQGTGTDDAAPDEAAAGGAAPDKGAAPDDAPAEEAAEADPPAGKAPGKTTGKTARKTTGAAGKAADSAEAADSADAEDAAEAADAEDAADVTDADEPAGGKPAGKSGDDEQADDESDPQDGPVFEAADYRAKITAGPSGIVLRLDQEEAEFGWDEVGAVAIDTPRLSRWFRVTVHTTTGRSYDGEVLAPRKGLRKTWTTELDAVLDACFEDAG